MQDPNQYLDEIVALIEANVDPIWTKVYGFRAAPDKYERYISAFYIGTNTKSGVNITGSKEPGMDYLVVLFAQHDGTEQELEDAERDLNAAEYAIVKTMIETRDNSWLGAIVPFPTFRPRQPPGLAQTRIAEIPFRLTPR